MKQTTLIFLAGLVLSSSTGAAADQFYVTVAVECSASKPELGVSFHAYWNEAGEKAIALAGKGVVDPRALVSFTQDAEGKYAIRTKSISQKCVLGKSKYEVTVAPLMAPRFHPEGFCAARIGAIATIKMKGRLVASEGVDACTETGFVTTEIHISPDRPVSFQRIPAEKFYAVG